MLVLAHGDRDVQAPLLDLNYGLGDRIQLKYQTPYIWDSEGGAGYRGDVGNWLFGVKWRFYQQEREGGWNISTYPQLDVNNPLSDSYARRLVPPGPRFLLPVEIARTLGPVDVNLEAGYWFNRRAPHERILGLALGHQFTKRLEGLTEVYDDVFLGGSQRSTTFDIGGRYQFHRRLSLLFMAGRSFGDFSGRASRQPYFIGYFGLQVQVTHGPRKKRPNSSRNPPIQ
jgi:hypothetical protein